MAHIPAIYEYIENLEKPLTVSTLFFFSIFN